MNICQECKREYIVKPGSYGKYCSLSCGSIVGARISKEKSRLRAIILEEEYYKTPKLCKQCNGIITFIYKEKPKEFCNRSCAATFTNKLQPPRSEQSREKTRQARNNNLYTRYQRLLNSDINTSELILPKGKHSKISFILCEKTQQYYLNRYSDGKLRNHSPYTTSDKKTYYLRCKFKFNVYHYPEYFDLKLLEIYGWYTCPGKKRKNKMKNIDGVSRDHIISINYGYLNDIHPDIISHPANCRLIQQKDNFKKRTDCGMSIEELNRKIKEWDEKYRAK